jgi:hypothetical protein
MMEAQNLDSKVQRLRDVMMRARERGYRGPGQEWACDLDPDLPQKLERGEHVAVLKSGEFVRRFFTPKAAISGITSGAFQFREIPAARVEGDLSKRLREAFKMVQSLEDPLDYLWEDL